MTHPHVFPSATAERDRDWVARIRAGEYDAFVACFRAYYGPVRAFAARLLDSEDAAEDVAQDVFFGIWQRRETWEVTSGLASYLYGAARNRAASQIRHRRVRAKVADAVRRMLDRDVSRPDEDMLAADLDAAVRQCIEGLPARCREAFELRWYHQLTYAEIGQLLGVSVKTVETHVTTGLKALRRRAAELQ